MDRSSQLWETLRTLGQVSMTWWVSASVLCATILGVSWSKRDEIRQAGRGAASLLFGVVGMFFVSVCAFGITMMWGTTIISTQLRSACLAEGGRSCTSSDVDAVQGVIWWGVLIGTTSFVLVTIAWVVACVQIRREEPQHGSVTEEAASKPRRAGRSNRQRSQTAKAAGSRG